MSRALYSTLALLLVSSSALGQELLVPKSQVNPVVTNNASFQPASFQSTAEQNNDTPAVQNTIPAPAVKPADEVKPYAMSTDTNTYPSSRSLHSGVSDYRFEVAKEKARARRLRMEVRNWYGIDTARPNTNPLGHLPTYSNHYNGVYSRPAYHYNRGGSFYFFQPINR